jgi:hypothetical protein
VNLLGPGALSGGMERITVRTSSSVKCVESSERSICLFFFIAFRFPPFFCLCFSAHMGFISSLPNLLGKDLVVVVSFLVEVPKI